jgi:acetyl esterase/lipase
MRVKFRTVISGVGGGLLGIVAGFWAATQYLAPEPPPPPAGASVEIQQAIQAAGPVNVAALKLMRPQTDSQWTLLQQGVATKIPIPFEEAALQLDVAVERDLVAGVPVHWLTPKKERNSPGKALFVYIHGGAYVFMGGDDGAREAAIITAASGIDTISIDYRMPPEHPHPAAVDDVQRVYAELLKRYPAKAIVMGGTSAGGGLTLAAVHRLKAAGLPLPAALYLGTPWADLTKSGDTLYTLEGIDRQLGTYDGILGAAAMLYAGDTPLTDPLLSPIYGEFSDFPPSYLVSGTRDLFLSDTARVAQKMRAAGVEVQLNVFEGLSHAEYAQVDDSPEHRQVYQGLTMFMTKHLDTN